MSPRSLFAGRTLALIGIILVAGTLRTAVAALSPIMSAVNADIPIPTVAFGILGMLPPVCYAVFGILSATFARRLSLETLLLLAITAIMLGHLGRALSDSLVTLLVATAVTFAGIGVGNVILPPLVKKYFPDRIGLVTSLYVTVLSVSALVPPLLAVPLADAYGWRFSLGIWLVPALIALLPWITLLIRKRTESPPPVADAAKPVAVNHIWRSSVAWAITIVLTVSSVNAYALFTWLPQILVEAAGTSAAQAGLLLSLFAAMGFPCALLIPVLATRLTQVAHILYAGTGIFIAGYLGLLLMPATLTWLWVVFLGIGQLLFPLALVLINLRTRTQEGAVALSGFVQGVGYTIAAIGPLGLGLLRELTGGWTWPIALLIGTLVVGAVAGVVLSRPRMLEDDLRR
jgi:CP family cyanate transporter-like MFS transporter